MKSWSLGTFSHLQCTNAASKYPGPVAADTSLFTNGTKQFAHSRKSWIVRETYGDNFQVRGGFTASASLQCLDPLEETWAANIRHNIFGKLDHLLQCVLRFQIE